MNVGSNNKYPAGALSNFSPHPFIFRGLPVASMEGFLQGLKFKNPEMQRSVFGLVGRKAKFRGKKKNWYESQTLWYQGDPIPRDSDTYQAILDEAFDALFTNAKARKALLATGSAVLRHSIGKSKIRETVLTEREFIRRLHRIRDQLIREKSIKEKSIKERS